jgi:hypothetical protein
MIASLLVMPPQLMVLLALQLEWLGVSVHYTPTRPTLLFKQLVFITCLPNAFGIGCGA